MNYPATYNGDVFVEGRIINGVVISGDNMIDWGFTLISSFFIVLEGIDDLLTWLILLVLML